jgi:hypothetical protein
MLATILAGLELHRQDIACFAGFQTDERDVQRVVRQRVHPRPTEHPPDLSGRGSAIFLHCARPDFALTGGCIALRLDDLTWEDLRLLAQRRIPAASGGAWTHHAPVDPGITLLELFAFLLEQQLYVLDQVPDSLVRAVLTLLGEAPRPTVVSPIESAI